MKKLDLLKPGHARAGQLAALARQVNDSQDAIALLEDQTREKGNEWLCEITLQGQRLLQIKELVGHGKWLEWLSSHCPLVTERQAQRYMRVASNPTRVSDSSAVSLREALRACSEPDEPKRNGVVKSWPHDIEGLARFAKLRNHIARHPLATWSRESRFKLAEGIAAILAELEATELQVLRTA